MLKIKALALAASLALPLSISAQTIANVEPPPLPVGINAFNLDLEQTRRYSATLNFEIVGHSYLKVPQRTPFAKGAGHEAGELGSGTSSVVVYDGIAYVAGYNYPPTLFGVLIVDVRHPTHMNPLGFVPCKPGTRCSYLRVDRKRKLLMFGNDPDPTNPDQPAAGAKVSSGWSFIDVSSPDKPREVGFVPVPDGATTHGFEIDGNFLYGCAGIRPRMDREAMQIINYADPVRPRIVAEWHVPGMLPGEERGIRDRNGPDGREQLLQCHEIVYHSDRLYTAWRDAGIIIFDVKDRARPRPILNYDYVPPFTGGRLGSAHTALPVVDPGEKHPRILVLTDEIFDCPTGFGRVADISDLYSADVEGGRRAPQTEVLSTIRSAAHDRVDASGKPQCDMPFTGPFGGTSHSIHSPVLDDRDSRLLYLTWYNEGLRAVDISNPYSPKEVGYYLSPTYNEPGGYVLGRDALGKGRVAAPRTGRQTREVFQDPDTKLIYMTDGNGGGMTVLRYIGPRPGKEVPGAR